MEKAERMKSRRQMDEERMEAEAESEREAKKVLELERDLDSQRMEKLERMKTRRQRPRRRWGRRRVKMDEERMEAESERVESERDAKKVELELERDLDSQRMEAEVQSWEAEVAEGERLVAKFWLEKAEMEAENKWKDKCKSIFQVWWDAWLQAKEQEEYPEGKGEDRESVRRPSSVMAVWELWKSQNEKLFVELSTSLSLEKSNRLLLNNCRKNVEFGTRTFLRELEDTELMPYCSKYIDFRSYWESKYGADNGQFEDITKMRCMKFSCAPVPHYVYKGPRPTTLQIFAAWIGGLSWPLQVYGLIAVRDFVDPQRNMIFNRHRDDCHIVTEEDPYLPLTGPTRSVVVDMNEIMGPVTIEAELKVKGAVESEDKYIILDFISLPALGGSSMFELAGPHMRLGISLGAVRKSVEANIFIRVVDGTWPTGFHGRFVANTASIDCSEVILLEFSGDGEMKQTRHVVSVEASGTLVVTLKAWEGEEVGSMIFDAVDKGRSFETLNVGSCSVQVIVAWSLIYPYCEELVPLKYKKSFNFRHANESSWK